MQGPTSALLQRATLAARRPTRRRQFPNSDNVHFSLMTHYCHSKDKFNSHATKCLKLKWTSLDCLSSVQCGACRSAGSLFSTTSMLIGIDTLFSLLRRNILGAVYARQSPGFLPVVEMEIFPDAPATVSCSRSFNHRTNRTRARWK